jgi:hypothetical protein
VSPCVYHYEDGVFYFFARARSAWAANLDRDGRVFLCIDLSDFDEDEGGKRVLVRGTAEVVERPRLLGWPLIPGDLMGELSLRSHIRYCGSEAKALAAIEHYQYEPFWLFRVTPNSLKSWSGDWAQRYKHADRVY